MNNNSIQESFFMKTLNSEKIKYDNMYKYKPEYGSANHGRMSYDIISSFKPKSVLDVGCGNGEFCKWVYDNLCKDVYGVDFASSPSLEGPTWIKSFAHDIPIDDNSIDIITTFDMVEHLVEENVVSVLKEFKRIAIKNCIFNISYFPSSKNGIFGENLHPTIKSEDWWLKKIKKVFEIDDDKIKIHYRPIINTEKKYSYIVLYL